MSPDKIKIIHKDFNYKLTEIFLNNTRLAILSLIVFLLVGGIATFVMFGRTTGFPNPELKFAQVLTIYPGASSTDVEKNITIPLEGAIKDVAGVKTYQSSSTNSVSSIFITIDEKANADSVRNKIDSALRGVELPTGAESPKVLSPEISGPDSIFAITGSSREEMYNTYIKFEKDLKQIPETSKVEALIPLEKKVVIVLDTAKLSAMQIPVEAISGQIQSIGAAIPVVSDVKLDDKKQTLVTTITGNQYEDIKNLPLGGGLKLSDIADIQIRYDFEKDEPSYVAFNDGDTGHVVEAITFQIKSVKGTNLTIYNDKVEELVSEYSNVKYYHDDAELAYVKNDSAIYELYSQANDNEEQVKEVQNGLWGGDLNIDNKALAKIGWFLGGLQLVFILMLLTVSWRAAIVAALSIPLSLMFSFIYLFITGEDLNTLVLFSLVLVIGLVVDPALVVLESLQRKIDTGIDPDKGARIAISNVGSGVFMAMLTNIIVFAPFAVISGVMGQIFIYIPLTIVPAIVGSYIIPLIFLTWIGSKFLKPTKGKTNDEEKNLWPIARGLIKLNTGILETHPFVRAGILFIALLIPVLIIGFYFGTGLVKQVQFASNDNSDFAMLEGSYLSKVPTEEHQDITQDILQEVIDQKGVKTVFLYSSGFNYYIQFEPAKERPDTNSSQIVESLTDKFEKDYNEKFFDIRASVLSVGPSGSAYQVAISVKTDDPELLEKTALDIRNTMLDLCYKENQVKVNTECNGGEKVIVKVDDGFTNKENTVLAVVLNRDEIARRGINIFTVNQIIKQLFILNDGNKLGTVQIDGDAVNIYLESKNDAPQTINVISETLIPTSDKSVVKLKEIAQIVENNSKSDILRVKGQNIGVINARLIEDKQDDQTVSALVTQAIVNYYNDNESKRTVDLGLEKDSIGQYSEGDAAGFQKSFTELITALGLAIVFSYFVLALFFKSFTQPLVIIFTIPVAMMGVIPGLAHFAGGQLGFLEIIGIIILVGIVENVAIFLIDGAHKKMESDGWDEKTAISHVSGIRLRPIILSTLTAVVSLLPLALFSDFYRSIAVVIMTGMLVSGIISLVTTPILFIFFKWVSRNFWPMRWWQKVLFLIPIFTPFYLLFLWWTDHK